MVALPQVSGTIACSIRDVMRERLPGQAFDRMLELVPPAARQAFVGLTPLEWMPVDDFNLTYHAAARALGRPVHDTAALLSRESAARTLHTVWRVLLRLTTDHALAMRAPVLYAKTFDTGKAETVFEADKRARVTVSGWRTIPDLSMLTLGVGIEAVFAIAGRASARALAKRNSDGVEYVVTW